MRTYAGLLITPIFVLCCTVCVAAESENGISKTKPAEGPYVEIEGGFLVPYTFKIPGSDVEIEMVPVPGGTFKFGSSEDSEWHEEDEGPQLDVTVGPMWVCKYETTWEQYKLYMSMYKLFKSLQGQGMRKISESNKVDAVTAPTELYDPTYTFEYGEEPRLPAVTMTQYSAKQFTKWLSKLTGRQYRLPTETEWEYACRGGSSTAFHFGEDPDDLDDYAWYFDNSDELPHEVGLKKPNQFGLYDMHGNVMEWAIDNYTDEGYAAIADEPQPLSVKAAIQWPDSFDGRVVRGGSFQDDPERVRSAARIGSEDEDWKGEDPNFPLSPWWYTDDPSRGVGFRLFRSYQPMDPESMTKFWDIDNEDIQYDVDARLEEGRGVLTPVDPSLAKDIAGSR